jgi:hypothetical protein
MIKAVATSISTSVKPGRLIRRFMVLLLLFSCPRLCRPSGAWVVVGPISQG